MPTWPMPLRWLTYALAAIALGTIALGGVVAKHDHGGTDGFYNPDCQLLALATLGGAFALAIVAASLAVIAAPAAAVLVVGADGAGAPHRPSRPRAPPLALG